MILFNIHYYRHHPIYFYDQKVYHLKNQFNRQKINLVNLLNCHISDALSLLNYFLPFILHLFLPSLLPLIFLLNRDTNHDRVAYHMGTLIQ